MKFCLRIATGSMPSSSAAMSMIRSSICVASGRPAPRYAAVAVVFVAALQALSSTFGIAYTPCAIVRVRNGRNAPIDGYAPPSWNTFAFTPVIMPSRRSPISTCCTWARPWVIATMFSERVSVHFTGRASSCAAFTATAYSAYMPVLAPKPPPTAGAITRTCAASSPATAAIPGCTPCAAWVGTKQVSPTPSWVTTIPFGSIGTAATRWFSMRCDTTTSASASRSGSSPNSNAMARLEPCSSKSSGAPSASAASTSITTGRGS